MPSISEVIAGLVPEAKARKAAEKKYVQFSAAEWAEMEANGGGKLEPAKIKALVKALFSGKVKLTR